MGPGVHDKRIRKTSKGRGRPLRVWAEACLEGQEVSDNKGVGEGVPAKRVVRRLP